MESDAAAPVLLTISGTAVTTLVDAQKVRQIA